MVSAHAVSAPAPRPQRGRVRTIAAWAGAILSIVMASQALAASAADGILRQLQSGAGVPATEPNATDLALLARFYEERQMRPLWISEQAATGRAHALAAILQAADQDGLSPDDYGATAIRQLLDADLGRRAR